MKVKTIVLIVLVVMSLAAGMTKVIQMPRDVQFFADAGLGIIPLILLGVLQVVGGVLAIFAATRMPGLIIAGLGFLISMVVILLTGNISFAFGAVIPVAFCGFLILGDRPQSLP